MRAILAMATMAAAALTLAGCSKKDASTGNAASPATATASPAASFTPPTSISRADYGGRTERRFRKLDKDGDGKLERAELPPKRADRLLRRMDKNGDGIVDSTEWSAAMLARFDRMDANHDGNLTSDERGKRGGGGGGRRQRQQQQTQQENGTIDDDGDEVDNGF